MIGTPHILDDDGRELPAGEIGAVWSEGGTDVRVPQRPGQDGRSRNERGWTTVGDIGYLDDEGYLYLTDRKADMIISGGVNIYPQEAENVLIVHPAVDDAAVFGIPHEELGEEVKAVVQPRAGRRPGGELEAELMRTATSASRSTSARARSTSPTSCRGTRRASCTSGCCATSTPRSDGG